MYLLARPTFDVCERFHSYRNYLYLTYLRYVPWRCVALRFILFRSFFSIICIYLPGTYGTVYYLYST